MPRFLPTGEWILPPFSVEYSDVKTGSTAARGCDKEYNSRVQKAKLVSKPEERAALYQ